MDLRTYRAKSLAEALRLVREDLGPGASLLHTRQVGWGLWQWLAGGPQIEVTASSEMQAPAIAELRAGELPRADLQNFRGQFRDHLLADRGSRSCSLDDLVPDPVLLTQLGLPVLLARIGDQLVKQHFDVEAARQLVDELHDAAKLGGLHSYDQLCQQLLELVASWLAIRGPIRLLAAKRRVVALVGPTGVGKTTTVAKLAARFHIHDGKRVALVAMDPFPVSAVHQLPTYAQHFDLPMEVVSSRRQLREALDRLADFDLVLLDTAGRSPRDAAQFDDLHRFLGEAQPDETHLVLSSVLAPDHLKVAADAFAAVGATAVVLTKVDEAATLGSLLPLVCNPRLPLSYVTDGQNVPYDIRPADRQHLASLIVGSALARAADHGEQPM